ncbi:MAG TPA: GNAT family N-acetyltransferase [archaeon]|nr:GNAT family N-acetyltransferase [archaeon]
MEKEEEAKEKDGNDQNIQIKGLLPLWYDKNTKKYLFFGGEYMENIHFWFDPAYFPLILKHLPRGTFLYDISQNTVQDIITQWPDLKEQFIPSLKHYFLNLSQHAHRIDAFLTTYSKKQRKTLRQDLNHVERQNLTVTWNNKIMCFDEVAHFNNQRFGQDSDYSDPVFVNGLYRLLKHFEKKGLLHAVILLDTDERDKIGPGGQDNKKVIGVEYAVFYNKTYYFMVAAYDHSYNNLGKYLTMLHLQRAETLQAEKVDLLSGEGGWKEQWKFQEEPYYNFQC